MASAKLTPTQKTFLVALGQEPDLTTSFYWTGGTVLSSEYLHHRVSDDIDLFTEAERVPMAEILVTLKRLQPAIGYETIDVQTSFNRNLVFLHYRNGTILKTEFTSYPFTRLEKGPVRFGVTLDSERDIAVNKLFTINQQPRSRDYVDLYFLMTKGGYTLVELRRDAKIKFDWHIDPIQLGSRFTNPDLSDWPTLVKRISPEEVSRFFEQAAQSLGTDIFE